MSSDTVWKRGAIGREHPSREALLAFIREQCTEDEKSRIDEHLLTDCFLCNRMYTELKQDSNSLSQLFDMSQRHYDPVLHSNQVFLHMRRGKPLTSVWTGKRKRKFQVPSQLAGRHLGRRAGLHVFRLSFPVAFGLLLLLTTVAIYSIASIVESQPRTSGLITKPQTSSTQFDVPGHQTPTTVTITPAPGLTASPTLPPTIIKGAKLGICGGAQYTSGWTILICGRGFKGVSKVWLEMEEFGSNSFRSVGSYPVDNAGNFKAYVGFSCKNSPVILYAADKSQEPLTLPVTGITKPGCYTPTPNATPGVRP